MKRYLGIDYGSKRIGLAIGSNGLARPLRILDNNRRTLEFIVNAIYDEKVDEVLVGLPLIDGEETKASKSVREFGNQLKKLLDPKISVTYIDEQYSSQDSLETAVEIGVARRNRKNDHALAACEIIKRADSVY